MTEMIETITKCQIRAGRLEKKIVKLKKQLADREEKIKEFDAILRYYPYARRTHEEKIKHYAMRDELEMLRKRVKEQEFIIEKVINGAGTTKYSDIVSDGGMDPRDRT